MGRGVRRSRRTLDHHSAPRAALAGRGMGGLGARTAQRLQYGTQGSEPNAAGSVSHRGWQAVAAKSVQTSAARDETRGKGTVGPTLHDPADPLCDFALFARLAGVPRRLERRRNRNLLRDRQHLDLHRRRHRPVPAQPAPALRQSALGHGHQVCPGRRHLSQQRDTGRLPEVEQDAPAGLVHRTNGESGAPAAARHLPQRAAHGIRAAAARRDSRQKSSMRVRRVFVGASGLDCHRGRYRNPDRRLHPNDEMVRAEPARRPDLP